MNRYRLFLFFIVLSIILSACNTPAQVFTPTETTIISNQVITSATIEPIWTPTVTQIPTAIITPTTPPEWPVYSGTAVPISKFPITDISAPLLKPVAIWNEGPIHTIAYSSDGKLLAAGSSTGIDILDPITMERVQHLTPQALVIWRLFFSPNGRFVAAFESRNLDMNQIEVFDVQTGKSLWVREGYFGLAGFSADSTRILTFSQAAFNTMDGTKVYSLETGNITLSGDGSRAAVATDKSIQIIQTNDGSEVTRFTALNCHQISLSRDGQILAAACNDSIRVWQTFTGKLMTVVEGEQVVLSQDGATFATARLIHTGKRGYSLTLWHLNKSGTGYESPVQVTEAIIPTIYSMIPEAVSFSINGQQLVAVHNKEGDPVEGNKAYFLIIDSQTGVIKQETKFLDCRGNTCFKLELYQVMVSPDGVSVAVLFDSGKQNYGNGMNLRVYPNLSDLQTGGYKEIVNGQTVSPSVLFNPGGEMIAYTVEGKLLFRRLDSEPKTTLELGNDFSGLVNFSVDGKFLCGNGNPPKCQIINDSFSIPFSDSLTAFSQDGKWVAWSKGNSIKVAKFNSPYTSVFSQEGIGHYVLSLAYSPDGKLFAASVMLKENDPTTQIIIWRVNDMKELIRFNSKGHATRLKFTPDNQFLLGIDSIGHNAASPGGYWVPSLMVWSVNNGAEIRKLDENDIIDYDLSPDGTMVAVGKGKWNSMNTLVQLIRVENGEFLQQYYIRCYGGAAVDFSPDGKLLATEFGNGVIVLWSAFLE